MRITIALLLAATIAHADVWVDPQGQVAPRPGSIGTTINVSDDTLFANGWQYLAATYPADCPEGERAVNISYEVGTNVVYSWDCEEIPEPVPTPAVFPEGIEASMLVLSPSQTNGAGWAYLASDTGELIPVLAHESPWPTQAEFDARVEAEVARRKAIRDELNLTSEQIDLIRQWAAADVDTLFSGMTAQQRRFLKIQHGLVRALAKSALKEIGE